MMEHLRIIVKKKLLITVGSGASLDFGLPSVGAVDKLLDDHAKQLFPLAHHPERNLYSHIRDKLNAYYAKNSKEGLRKWANFEDVIYQVNVLASLFSDSGFENGANALLRAEELPDVLRYGREVSQLTLAFSSTLQEACRTSSLSTSSRYARPFLTPSGRISLISNQCSMP